MAVTYIRVENKCRKERNVIISEASDHRKANAHTCIQKVVYKLLGNIPVGNYMVKITIETLEQGVKYVRS